MSDIPQLTASVLAAEQRLGSRTLAWDAVLATVAAAHGLDPEGEPPADSADAADAVAQADLVAWRDPAGLELLAPTHETLVAGRQASGTFYTPPGLVEWILDRLPDESHARVLDPACGAGHLLLARTRRLVARGVPAHVAVTLVHGVDLDPVAVAIARLRLRALAPDADPTTLDVRVGDGLHPHPGAPYDVVIGNPPFLGRLRNRLPAAPDDESVPAPVVPVPKAGAYTDLSGLFLRHAFSLVRPGGTVALVQPLSLLAARDAAPVREAVVEAGAVTAFWSSLEPVFAGTAVLTCVPVVTTDVAQGPVPTWFGPDFVDVGEQALPEHEWGPVVAAAAGIPVVTPRTDGTLGDLGRCTADFRDQYYGLVPFVGESAGTPGHAPLVTAGLIDPAECRWGEAPTRFAKTRFEAPGVDLEALHADGALSAWARARLVPKVLVATQGRVIEAVVDETGDWLPSVPVLTVVAEPDRLWHVLAVLLAPPVVATAAAQYLGTALAPGAIKLSARQVASLPLPADLEAWDRGAAAARSAQLADPTDRREHLVACAEAMCAAYDDDGALAWWSGRLRPG